MYCKNCGAQIDNDSNFCSSCGSKVSESPWSPEESNLNLSSEKQSKNINVTLSIGGVGKKKTGVKEIPSPRVKKTEKYPHDITAVIIGIIFMIGIVAISLTGGIESEEIYIPVSIALILLRLITIFYAYNRAKKLRRDKVAFAILGFLLPLISLVVLGLLPRKRLVVSGTTNDIENGRIEQGVRMHNSEGVKPKSSSQDSIVRVILISAMIIIGITGILLLIAIWMDGFDWTIRRIVSTNIVLLLAIGSVRLILLIRK